MPSNIFFLAHFIQGRDGRFLIGMALFRTQEGRTCHPSVAGDHEVAFAMLGASEFLALMVSHL